MNRLGLITCALALCTAGVAHANQVDAPPPPPAPSATSPAPTPAVPPPPPPPPAAPQTATHTQWQSNVPSDSHAGTEVHDGFFLRMALGFGGARWSEDVSPSTTFSGDLEMSGVSVGIDIAVGAVITDNLALHASLFGMGISDPEVIVDGESLGTAKKTSLSGSGLGVGLTYYLMPANVYLSAAIGFGSAGVTFNAGTSSEERLRTKSGVALNLMVGKEWWVSDQWGIGIAAALIHINVPDDGTRLSGTGLQLMFSATYN